jgi:NTE family protein
MTKQMRPKIGLALGSGGAKGLSHIGVIRVLEDNNIPIDFIAGSSVGACIGGFYAVTRSVKNIEEVALPSNWRQMLSLFLDPSLHQGLVDGKKIINFIESIIGKIYFKDLKIPLSVVATDIKTGEAVVINEGEVALAIRASASIPLVFKPVKRNNKLLADGGLSLPVPVKVVKKMGADIVIAVNLDAGYFSNNINSYGFYGVANTSIKILRYHLSSLNAKEADIVVNPKIGEVGWDKVIDVNSKKIIRVGEEVMRKLMPQLKDLIRHKR